MQKICTDIIIDAPAEKVWSILTDFESFDDWNPFIQVKKGKLETGAQLEVLLQLPGRKAITMKPTVVKVEPVREFRWSGSMWVKGIFDWEHAFRIEELDENRSRLIQCERFKGVIAPLILHIIGEDVQKGFESMNLSLKKESEKA
jgi:hypothetical protein